MHSPTVQTLKTASRETQTTKSVLGSRCHSALEPLRSGFPRAAHVLDVLQSRDFRHSVVLQETRRIIVPKDRRQDRSVLLEALPSVKEWANGFAGLATHFIALIHHLDQSGGSLSLFTLSAVVLGQ